MKRRIARLIGLKRLGDMLGFDVVAVDKSDRLIRQLERFFVSQPIDLLLDCGANRGLYSRNVRRAGYRGEILAFEPVPAAFAELDAFARQDGHLEARQMAVGERAGTLELRVFAANSVYSSAFDVEPGSEHAANMVGSETVQVPIERLDAVLAREKVPETARIFVKSDTQGYDLRVLEGLGDRMKQVVGLQLEMSVRPLYKGAPSHWDTLDFVRRAGFEPWGFASISRTERGALIEYDAVFARG